MPKEGPLLAGSRHPSTTDLVLTGSLGRSDVAGMCDRAQRLLEHTGADLLLCDVAAVTEPDLGTVDALARLELTARRLGRHVRLCQASIELRELIALAGLRDVVPGAAGLRLQPERKAEGREEARRVEEEGDPADPAA